jgi:hypothetical protein
MAKIGFFKCIGSPSSINVTWTTVKEIGVFIGEDFLRNPYVQQGIFRDYINSILGHEVQELYFENGFPEEISRYFIMIIRQLSAGVPPLEIVDINNDNMPILNNITRLNFPGLFDYSSDNRGRSQSNTPSNTQPNMQPNIPSERSQPVQAGQRQQIPVSQLSNLLNMLNNPNQSSQSSPSTHSSQSSPSTQPNQAAQQRNAAQELFGTVLQRLLGNLSSGLASERPVGRPALDSLVQDMNTLYSSQASRQLGSQPANRQNLNSLIQNMNAIHANRSEQTIHANRSEQPIRSMHSNLPIPPILSIQPIQPIQQSNSVTNLLSVNNPRMIRNISDPQPNPNLNLDGNLHETELPARFTESRTSNREIYITNAEDTPNNLNNLPNRLTDNMHDNEQKRENTTEQKRENTRERYITGDLSDVYPSPDVQYSSLPRVALERNSVSKETIVSLAKHIHRMIVDCKTKAPDFNNITKVGYRKMKNYIHNITSVWLSQEEINIFIDEINSLREAARVPHTNTMDVLD